MMNDVGYVKVPPVNASLVEGSPQEEALDKTGEDVLDRKVDKRNVKSLGPRPKTVRHSGPKGR